MRTSDSQHGVQYATPGWPHRPARVARWQLSGFVWLLCGMSLPSSSR
jgi:hypothetical protein